MIRFMQCEFIGRPLSCGKRIGLSVHVEPHVMDGFVEDFSWRNVHFCRRINTQTCSDYCNFTKTRLGFCPTHDRYSKRKDISIDEIDVFFNESERYRSLNFQH